MSKIFDAMNMVELASIEKVKEMPGSIQHLRPPISDNRWKNQYHPKFSEYRVDRFLEYLLSLYTKGERAKYGIVPATDAENIPEIVLDTVLHFSANCEDKVLLTDLSITSKMHALLDSNHSFDHQVAKNESQKVMPVMQDFFHFLSLPDKSISKNRASGYKIGIIENYIGAYDISLFLFPTVESFNVDCVKLARQLDYTILMSPESAKVQLSNTGQFLSKLGVPVKGAYLVE